MHRSLNIKRFQSAYKISLYTAVAPRKFWQIISNLKRIGAPLYITPMRQANHFKNYHLQWLATLNVSIQ
jgi:hypothetical protein